MNVLALATAGLAILAILPATARPRAAAVIAAMLFVKAGKHQLPVQQTAAAEAEEVVPARLIKADLM